MILLNLVFGLFSIVCGWLLLAALLSKADWVVGTIIGVWSVLAIILLSYQG